MSKYTTEVRYICEHYAGVNESTGYADINKVIESARSKVFDFPYPIFDEKYREVLEKKILKHYYVREIGMETVGLWKHYLDMKMNEIMPYYNQLYKSELLEFNPLYDVDVTREHERTNVEDSVSTKEGNTVQDKEDTRTTKGSETTNNSGDKTKTSNDVESGESEISYTGDTKLVENVTKNSENIRTQGDTTNSEENSEGWQLYSDTPQGSVQNVELNGYLTNATKNTSDTTGKVEYDSNVNETFEGTDSKTNTVTDDRKTNETHNNTVNGTENEEYTNNGSREREENVNENGKTTTSVNEKDSGNINSTEDYLEHVRGKQGASSYSSMLMEYRKTFLNIDMDVINDLSDLFMMLW